MTSADRKTACIFRVPEGIQDLLGSQFEYGAVNKYYYFFLSVLLHNLIIKNFVIDLLSFEF